MGGYLVAGRGDYIAVLSFMTQKVKSSTTLNFKGTSHSTQCIFVNG